MIGELMRADSLHTCTVQKRLVFTVVLCLINLVFIKVLDCCGFRTDKSTAVPLQHVFELFGEEEEYQTVCYSLPRVSNTLGDAKEAIYYSTISLLI